MGDDVMDLFVQYVIERKLFRQPIQIGEIYTFNGVEYILVKYVDFRIKGDVLSVRGIFQLANAEVKKFGTHQDFKEYVYVEGKYTKFDNGQQNGGVKIGSLNSVEDEFYRIDELIKLEVRGTNLYCEYAVTMLEPLRTGITRKDLTKHRIKEIGLTVVK